MALLVVDLQDADDIRDALAELQARLARIGVDAENAADSAGLVPAALARRIVDDLWGRIGSEKTFDLLRSFAELDGDVTLTRIAQHLDATPDDIRARKFRFGRTENALNDKYGIELLPSAWNGAENVYRMPESIRREIRARA